jgi:hypothetical protein
MNTDDFRKAYIRHASALLRQPNLTDDARQSGHDVGDLGEKVLDALDRANGRAEDMADALQSALATLSEGARIMRHHEYAAPEVLASWQREAERCVVAIAELGGPQVVDAQPEEEVREDGPF